MLCPALLALLALPWTPPDPNDLHCELQRYDAASYTPTSLAELIRAQRVPIILENAVRWDALSWWQSRDYFVRRHGAVRLPRLRNGTLRIAQEGPQRRAGAGDESEWTLKRLVEEMAARGAGAPFFFEAAKSDQAPIATGPLAADLGAVEALSALDFERQVFSIGGPGGGLPAHKHAAAWLALVVGSKRWSLLGPEEMPHASYGKVVLQSSARWSDASREALKAAGMLECTQRAGEVLYLPALWWHATVNVGDVIGVGAQAKTVTDLVDERIYERCGMTNSVLGNNCMRVDGPRCSAEDRRFYLERALQLEPLNPKHVTDYATELLRPDGPAPPDLTMAVDLIGGQGGLIVGLHESSDIGTADALGVLAQFTDWLRWCLDTACLAAEAHLRNAERVPERGSSAEPADKVGAVAVGAHGGLDGVVAGAPAELAASDAARSAAAAVGGKWKVPARKALRRLSMVSQRWEAGMQT